MNLRRHGFDFADAFSMFEGQTKTACDKTRPYAESRFLTLGVLQNCVVVVAHAATPDMIRGISMRKATKREQGLYF